MYNVFFFAFFLLFLGAKLRSFCHIHNTSDVLFYIPNIWYMRENSMIFDVFLSLFDRKILPLRRDYDR